MADELGRIISRFEVQGKEAHDASLRSSMSLIDSWGKQSAGAFGAAGSSAEVAGAKIKTGLGDAIKPIKEWPIALAPARAEIEKVGSSAAASFGTLSNTSKSSLRDIVIWGDGISTSVKRFTSDLQTVPPSFNAVGAASQSVGPAVANSMGQATSALASMAPAAAAAASSFIPIGVNVQDAGAKVLGASSSALGGLQGLAKGTLATGSSIDALKVQAEGLSGRIAGNAQIIGQWGSEIGQSKVQLAELNNRVIDAAAQFGNSSKQVTTLKNEYTVLSGATRQLGAEHGVLSRENRALGGQLTQTNTAVKALSLAENVGIEATNAATSAFARKTNMINTGQGPLRGYDALIQAVARSMGGIPVAIAIAIPIIAALGAKLFDLGSEKERQIKIDKEQLTIDALRVSSMAEIANLHTQGAAALQTNVRASADMVTAFQILQSGQSKYQKDVVELEKSLTQLRDEGSRHTTWLTLLTLGIYNTGLSAEGMQKHIGELTASIEEQEKKMLPALEVFKQARNIYGLNTDSLLDMAQQMHFFDGTTEQAAKTQAFFREQLESDLPILRELASQLEKSGRNAIDMERAMLSLSIGLNTVKQPSFEVSGTLKGIENTSLTLGAAIETAKGKLFDWGSVAATVKPDAEAANKALKEYATFHAQGADKARLSADALRIYKERLSQLPPEQQKAIKSLNDSVLAADAFSTSIKKVKQELDKNSPFITERVLAGNAGDLNKAMGEVADEIRASFLSMRDGMSASGKDLAKSLLKGMQDEIGGKGVGVGASLLKDFGPQIDAASKELERIRAQAMDALGGGKSTREKLMEGFVKQTLEALGITGEAWLKYSQARKNEINSILVPSAELYANAILTMELRAKTSITNLDIAYRELARGIDSEGTRKIMASFDEMGQAAIHMGSDISKVFEDVKIPVKDLSDYVDEQIGKVRTNIESMIQPWERVQLAEGQAVRGLISDLEELGIQSGKTGDALDKFVLDRLGKVTKEFGVAGQQAVKEYTDNLNKLPGALDKSVNQMLDVWAKGDLELRRKVKGTVADILGVIDTMPGEIGDSLRKGQNEFTKWFNFIDSTIKLLQGILNKEKTGIAGVIQDIIGVHKTASTAATTSAQTQTAALGQVNGALSQSQLYWNDWATAVEAANRRAQAATSAYEVSGGELSGMQGSGGIGSVFGGMGGLKGALEGIFGGHSTGGNEASGEAGESSGESFAAGFLGKLSLISAGVATFFGSRGQGKLQGVLGGAAAGAQIGTAILPGWGTAIGAGIGAIAGLFKSGKSKEQEAAEKAAAERAKLDLQQTGVNIVNAALDGFSKGFDFLSKLDEFTKVHKSQFNKFFKNFSLLMDHFIALSKKWTVQSLDQAKAAAEAINPVVDTMSALPDAFEGIRFHTEIAESRFTIYWRDADRLMEGWFHRAEDWSGKQAKKIGKISERLLPSLELTSGIGDVLKSIIGIKEPTDEEFNVIDRILEKMTNHLGALAEKFEKRYLKTLEYFSEKAKSGLGLWKDTVDVIRASIDVPQLKESDAENVVGGLELFFNKLVSRLGSFASDQLANVKVISETVVPISSGIKAWGEATAVIREYTAIGATVWEDIVTDWRRGLDLTSLMIADAKSWLEKGLAFESYAQDAKDHWLAGVAAYGDTVTGIASGLNASIGHLQGGVPTTGAAFAGATSFSASSFTPSPTVIPPVAFVPPSPSGSTSRGGDVYVTVERGAVVTNGPMTDEDAEEVFRRGIKKARERGFRLD